MVEKLETVGDYIQWFRRVRGITVRELCDQTHISTATYARLINGETPLKLTRLYDVFAALAVTPQDFFGANSFNLLWFWDLKEAVFAHYPRAAADYAQEEWAEEAIVNLLNEYRLTGNAGVNQLTQYLKICLALGKNDGLEAKRAANQLAEELCQYRYWSSFEIDLFVAVVSLVEFSHVEHAMRHILTWRDRRLTAEIPANTELLGWEMVLRQSDMAISFFERALETRNTANVLLVAVWVFNQEVDRADLYFQAHREFASAVIERMTGDVKAATSKYQQSRILREKIFGPLRAFERLDQLWETFLALSNEAPRVPEPELPIDFKKIEDFKTYHGSGGIIELMRQAKEIKIFDLDEQAGISRSTYQRIARSNPSITSDALFSVVNALRLGPDDLLMQFFDFDIALARDMYRLMIATTSQPLDETQLPRLVALRDEFLQYYELMKSENYEMMIDYAQGIIAQSKGDDAAYTKQLGKVAQAAYRRLHRGITFFDLKWLGLTAGARPELVEECIAAYESGELKIPEQPENESLEYVASWYIASASISLDPNKIERALKFIVNTEASSVIAMHFGAYGLLHCAQIAQTESLAAANAEHQQVVDAVSRFFADTGEEVPAPWLIRAWQRAEKKFADRRE